MDLGVTQREQTCADVPKSRLGLWFRLQKNNPHLLRLSVVSRVDANGQAAFRERGLKGARALHHEKRRLRRHAIHFLGRIRLRQKFHHFNLGSHTLSQEFVRSKRASAKEFVARNTQSLELPRGVQPVAFFLAKNCCEEIPLGTSVEFWLACHAQ
jgi:hypothetical protein